MKIKKIPNILGVSGKKRSGKDLIGIIIQWLVFQETVKGTPAADVHNFQEWVDFTSIIRKSPWKIVKYADKLKDIVCLLIGCTREQLEEEKFKNTELGEEWRTWELGWLDEMSISYQTLFSSYDEYVNAKEIINQEGTNNIFTNKNYILTPRQILQKVGTELFRNQFNPQVWVNATMADYKPITYNGLPVDFIINAGSDDRITYPKWIITDVRFENEIKAIRDRDGIIIRVERPSIKSNDKHASEIALDGFSGFDYTIINNGNLEDLINKVNEILIKEGII